MILVAVLMLRPQGIFSEFASERELVGMSAATVYYLSGLGILFGINLIAIWGLDLHFGLAGINSFAFIIFQAIGAYVGGGAVALGRQGTGASRPTSARHQLAVAAGAALRRLVGAVLAVPVGLIAVRRLRGDYQAMAMLVLALIANGLIGARDRLVQRPDRGRGRAGAVRRSQRLADAATTGCSSR